MHGNLLIASLILLAMACAAAVTASRRAPEIKNTLLVCFYAIAAGSSVVIAVLLATKTLTTYVQTAVYASLLPRLDMLKSLGFVWIPAVMAGMLVSGASPIYAGIFQFIVVAMILGASGIAGLVATLLMRARVFSTAAQLTLRPGISESQHPRETNLAV